jgi:hypothetical protein
MKLTFAQSREGRARHLVCLAGLAACAAMLIPVAPLAAASASAAAAPAAPAPYFISLLGPNGSNGDAYVYNSATGERLATLKPPGGGDFWAVSAAANDRTFILVTGNSTDSFYKVQLNGSGKPGSLSPVHVSVAVPAAYSQYALSPDASELAVSIVPGGNFDAHGEMTVISLATGKARTWRSSDPGYSTWLSWTAKRGLAFYWWDGSSRAGVAAKRSGLRLLDTASSGSNLLASSRLLISESAKFGAYQGVDNPVITPNGSTVFGTMVAGASTGNAQAKVVEFSVATGHPLRSVSPVANESGMGTWCGALWTDASGGLARAVCEQEGMIRNGHFAETDLHFPVPPFGWSKNFFAW